MEEMVFLEIDGKMYPQEPFPMKFFISHEQFVTGRFEIRQISFSQVIIACCKNWITRNWFRFLCFLNRNNLLDCKEGGKLTIKKLKNPFNPLRSSKEE